MKSFDYYKQNIIYFLQIFYTRVFKKSLKILQWLTLYERIIVISVWVIWIIMLIFPVFLVSPNQEPIREKYIFLWSWPLIKIFIISILSGITILMWYLNLSLEKIVREQLWFQGNKNLFTIFLLIIILSNIVAIGDTISLFQNYTTIVKLTIPYYVIQILLLVVLFVTGILLFTWSKSTIHWRVVGYRLGDRNTSSWKNDTWLFSDVQHTEEE